MASNTEITARLDSFLEELRGIMTERRNRVSELLAQIESLQSEIAEIERQNETLERTVADLLKSF
jgi:cell division protein FtsB